MFTVFMFFFSDLHACDAAAKKTKRSIIVSENDNCHCAGNTKVAVLSWQGTSEEHEIFTLLQ